MKGRWLAAVVALALVLVSFGALPAPKVMAATCTSTGTGNWNTSGTWSCGHVPAASDDVTIADGHTVTVDVDTNNLASLIVNGILTVGNDATGRTVTVSGDVNIGSSGSIAPGTTAATHSIALGASLTNNGTFDGLPGANRIINVTFNKNGNQTVSGTGTTKFNILTLNMGTSSNNVLDVQAVISLAASSNPLVIQNGTFKLSSNSTITPFTSNTGATIPATGGFWVNGGTVSTGALTWTLNGLLRVSAGTLSVGTGSGNSVEYNSGASFTMEGGTFNIAGRLSGTGTTQTITVNMSGGTLTVTTQGNGATKGDFDIPAAGSSYTMSGGIIIIQNASTNATPLDYRNAAGTVSITGGTVQFGNASTTGSPTFNVGLSGGGTSTFPNLTIDADGTPTVKLNTAITVKGNISIASSTTLNTNNQNISVAGNWTNNGTFTAGTGTVTFNGTSAQTIGGSSTTVFNNVTISAGVDFAGGSATAQVNGTLQINSGGSVNTNPPTYGSASTLKYNGGTVNISNEWKGGTSGAGVPYNVEIAVGSALQMGTATGDRTALGTITINGSLIANDDGDLFVGGNWTNNNAFTYSNRSVTFNNTSVNQTISGTSVTTFYKITLDKGSSSCKVVASVGVNITGGGSIIWTNGTWEQSAGRITFYGTADQSITANGGLILSGSGSATYPSSLTGSGGSGGIAGTLTVNTTGDLALGNGDDRLETGPGSAVTFAAGTVSIGGRLTLTDGTVTISGATVNIDPQASASLAGTQNVFEAAGAANVTMSGGSVTIVDPLSTSGAGRELLLTSGTGTKTFSGGTINFGNGTSSSAGSADGFEVNAGGINLYNLTVKDQKSGTNRTVRLLNNGLTLDGALSIDSGGTLDANGQNINLKGNWSNSGTFTAGTGTVTFNGGTTQNLTLNASTTFNNLTVGSGTTLVETVSTDNATVSGTLTNNGTIRKSQSIGGTGSYTFGLAGGPVNGANLNINVTADSFTSIQVDRKDSQHAHYTGTSEQSGVGYARYWTLTPDGTGTVNLTLPANFTTGANSKVCRWSNGAGYGWDCAMTSYTSNTVTRNGVSSFSDWAAGNAGPTAITILSLTAASPLPATLPVLGLFALGGLAAVAALGIGAGLVRRRRE